VLCRRREHRSQIALPTCGVRALPIALRCCRCPHALDPPAPLRFLETILKFPLTFLAPSRPLDDVSIQSAAKFFSAPLVFLLMVKRCSASYPFSSLLRGKIPTPTTLIVGISVIESMQIPIFKAYLSNNKEMA
jgi:hypothetical protein